MNTEVAVRSTLATSPVVVRALLANCCPRTQISNRLAKKLGLTAMRDVYVRDDFCSSADRIKWKISLTPITFTAKVLEAHNVKTVYPLINWNSDDAYYEMIIGQDCPAQWEALNAVQFNTQKLRASPGPSFNPDTEYMGHNVSLVNLSDFVTPPDEFFEYLCFDSPTVSRLAVNKATAKMVVVYHHDAQTVHQYDQVPAGAFQMLDAKMAEDEVVRVVKEACAVSMLEEFPDAVLTNVDIV